jgi:hypothetical protein
MKRSWVRGMIGSDFLGRTASQHKVRCAKSPDPARALWRLLLRRIGLVVALMTGLVLSLAPYEVGAQHAVAIDKVPVCISPRGEVRVVRVPELPNLPTRCAQGWKMIVVPAKGPRGEQGEAGPQGIPGTPGGRDCWDLNENGVKDLATEDANGDGRVDVLDCKGAQGVAGPPGPLGQLQCETKLKTYGDGSDADFNCDYENGYTPLFAVCEGVGQGSLILNTEQSGTDPNYLTATGVHCKALLIGQSTARLRCCRTVAPPP